MPEDEWMIIVQRSKDLGLDVRIPKNSDSMECLQIFCHKLKTKKEQMFWVMLYVNYNIYTSWKFLRSLSTIHDCYIFAQQILYKCFQNNVVSIPFQQTFCKEKQGFWVILNADVINTFRETKEWPGSIVTETLKNEILIPIAT